jgi:hypothetical protein
LLACAYTGNAWLQISNVDRKLNSPVQYPKLALQVKDSLSFKVPYVDMKWYYYKLIVPKERASETVLLKIMQDDMRNYFGYEAFSETRVMPYYSLMSTDKMNSKLKTKGEPAFERKDHGYLTIKNKSTNELADLLDERLGSSTMQLINETDIMENIDINIEAAMTNLDDVNRALKEYDLKIIKAEKPMKVWVVKDVSQNQN